MDASAVVEERVRAGVRERGIDPQADPEAVRELVDRAVAELLNGAWDDAGALGGEANAVAEQAFSAVAGFGPLQRYFDDPEVEEVWINAPDRVFVARGGRSELTPLVLDAVTVRDLVERMLRQSGRRLDISQPFVDAMLPDGSRLHVAIPDVTREHWAVNVRRFVASARTLDDLVRLGMLGSGVAALLHAAVLTGLNVLVAGATQAGKTTLVNALLGSVPSGERIVTCEEVFELRLDHPDWVGLQTRGASLEGTGEISLRTLVREALRMRPTRLVVGEVRQAEALDLLVAMNSGLPAMATIHANSAREAITKLCTLPLLAGQNISADFVVPTVAGCLDLVVHLAVDASGSRRVREVCAVDGRGEAGVSVVDLVVDRGEGPVATGAPFAQEARLARIGVDARAVLGVGA